MSAPATPWLARGDRAPLLALVLLSLAVYAGIATVASRQADLPLPALALYSDGFVYIEIAKSFPLPYAAEAEDYTGHAPGYPGVAWMLHRLLSLFGAGWGTALLLASWIPAALAAALFCLVCREAGIASRVGCLLGGLLFAFANPRWVSVAATAHAEPVAMLLAVGMLLAALRGRHGTAAILLAGCVLTRFPSLLLGLPLAYWIFVARRDFRERTILMLSVPLFAFALFNLYLDLRIPDYVGLDEAHGIFWELSVDWPFAALAANAERWLWSRDYPIFEVTYASAAFYVLAFAIAIRPGERERWVLAVWIAVLVLFHASLTGIQGVWDFARLVVLAWPAALLAVWRPLASRVPTIVTGAFCIGAAAFGIAFSLGQIEATVAMQTRGPAFQDLPAAISGIDRDEPRWLDLGPPEEEGESGEPGGSLPR